MPPSRRANTFCKSNKLAVANEAVHLAANPQYLHQKIDACTSRNQLGNLVSPDKYYKLNLEPLTSDRQPTIEFRQHSSTYQRDKAKNWIRFCVAFVYNSAKNRPPAHLTKTYSDDELFDMMMMYVVKDRSLRDYYRGRKMEHASHHGDDCCDGCATGSGCATQTSPGSTHPATMSSTMSCCLQCQKEAQKFCSRCREATYCSVDCQRAHFKVHKMTCSPIAIVIDASLDFDQVQSLVSSCEKGGVVLFQPGHFKASSSNTRAVGAQRDPHEPPFEGDSKATLPASLLVRRAITLKGSWSETGDKRGHQTTLSYGIVVDPSEEPTAGGKLILSGLNVCGDVDIKDNAFQRIELSNLRIEAHANRVKGYTLHVDALNLENCSGNKGILLDRCEILGGWGGVNNVGSSNRLHVKDCEIRFACCRGIFSNNHIVIEDTEVSNCGSYGIKDRGGRTLRGDNVIQQGPWDGLFEC